MKRAFTLIEILVSITILVLISGGALVYINNFNNQQQLIASRNEVVSALKLAQSYAKTRQVPLGSTETDLKYVQFQMLGSNLVAGANGIGSTFFASQIGKNINLSIGISPTVLYFWGGNGFLSSDNKGTLYKDSESAKIILKSETKQREIIIKALGLIE